MITGLHGEQPADADQAPAEVVAQSVLVNSEGDGTPWETPDLLERLAQRSHLEQERLGTQSRLGSWELGRPDNLLDGLGQNNKSTNGKFKKVLVQSTVDPAQALISNTVPQNRPTP